MSKKNKAMPSNGNVIKFKRETSKNENDKSVIDFIPAGELTIGDNTYFIGLDPDGYWRLGKADLEGFDPEKDYALNINEVCTCGINITANNPPTVFLSAVMTYIEDDLMDDFDEDEDDEEDDN